MSTKNIVVYAFTTSEPIEVLDCVIEPTKKFVNCPSCNQPSPIEGKCCHWIITTLDPITYINRYLNPKVN